MNRLQHLVMLFCCIAFVFLTVDLSEVASEVGLDAVISNVKFLIDVFAFVIHIFISVIQLFLNIITTLLESVPVIE